jgi:hypothetical protein
MKEGRKEEDRKAGRKEGRKEVPRHKGFTQPSQFPVEVK